MSAQVRGDLGSFKKKRSTLAGRWCGRPALSIRRGTQALRRVCDRLRSEARELRAKGVPLNGFSPDALADAEKKNKDAPLTAAQAKYARALLDGIPKGGMEQYSDAVGASFKA